MTVFQFVRLDSLILICALFLSKHLGDVVASLCFYLRLIQAILASAQKRRWKLNEFLVNYSHHLGHNTSVYF